MTSATLTQARPTALARTLRALPALTLLAVLTITASAEYALARTVLDLPPQIAWALPAAIDSYVLAALHTRRDVPAAIAVMAGALMASMGAHLAQVGRAGHPLPATWTAPLATAIMTVLVVVAWRVHVLIDTPAAVSAPDTAPARDVDGVRVTVTEESSALRPPVSAPVPNAPAPSTPQLDPPAAIPQRYGPDTPQASDRAPSGAPASTNTPPTPSGSAAESSAPVTDEQILAAITGQPPSIRALMRAHGIGQSRASRLHRIAQHHHIAQQERQSEELHEDTDKGTKNQHEAPEPQSENHLQTDQNENPNTATEISTEESRTKAEEESHICITDRVGQSRSTAADSSVLDHPIPAGLEVA